jgi:hypothetical protein
MNDDDNNNGIDGATATATKKGKSYLNHSHGLLMLN